jgi:copper transport protein
MRPRQARTARAGGWPGLRWGSPSSRHWSRPGRWLPHVAPTDRRAVRSAAAVLVAVIGFFVVVAPASAHTTLVSTDPADGAVVPGPVRAVSATFDETVRVSPDSLRVFSPDGRRVDTGGTLVGAAPSSIRVLLTPVLAQGTYTVAWHVVSADTHPLQGAFTFSIGHRSSHLPGSSVVGGASGSVSTLYALDRAVGYAGFVIAAGGMVFLAVCWPAGARRRRTTLLLATAWLAAVISALLQLPLQGALAADRRLGAIVDPHVVRLAFEGRTGIAVVVRVLALGFLAVLGLVLRLVPQDVDQRSRRPLGALFLLVAGFAAVTWSAAGHAGTGSWWVLALLADVVHLVSAALWLGGLALLVGVVLRGRTVDDTTARNVVQRFSPMAAWCVLLIAVTGTYQSWRNTRSWAALLDTDYGLLICVKVFLVVLLVLLGLRARSTLGARPFRERPAAAVGLARLRRGVLLEAAVAGVVLAVTAILVQTPTPRESHHPVPTATRPFDTGTAHGFVTATLTPARLGPNRVRLRLTTDTGSPYRARQVIAALSQHATGVGPLGLKLDATAAGSFESSPVSLSFGGVWTLTLVVRSDAFNEATVSVSLALT